LFLQAPDLRTLQWRNTTATRYALAFSKFTHTHSRIRPAIVTDNPRWSEKVDRAKSADF
jgi:hypothetical protein